MTVTITKSLGLPSPGQIFGLFNVPAGKLPDGTDDPSILPWTRKTLRELFDFCLRATGEIHPNPTIRPEDEKILPWVDWTAGISPAAALAELCDACGYRAVYRMDGDQIVVEPA